MPDLMASVLSALVEKGTAQSYLTYEEMNEQLPDDFSPDALDNLLMVLDEKGIELIDEADVQDDEETAGPEKVEAVGRGKAGARSRSRAADGFESDTRRIDDPVRMYLTQMGEIPLLTRAQEIALAKKIEMTRMHFRRRVLESDYCMAQAAEILHMVSEGLLPFDRTMKISTSEHAAKARISARIPVNLATVRALMQRNEETWEDFSASRLAAAKRKEFEDGLRERRRKISKLIEELSLRTSRIQPLMKRLRGLHSKMLELQRRIASEKKRRTMPSDDFLAMKEEL
ncbi:MAG: RNA polymerase subunit sigma-70, partial [Chrysiogenales bacterium]